MISSLVLIMAAQASAAPVDYVDLAIEWQSCVENFAIDQVRSGESSEVLISVGEAECVAEFEIFERNVETYVMNLPEVKEGLESLSRADVERMTAESIANIVSGYRDRMRAAALRNVVFVKARMAEIEGQ